MLEYRVLNSDCNTKKMYMMNIFDNGYVRENTIAARDSYLAAPETYSRVNYRTNAELYGYEAFRYEIRCILMHEFWSRCQYEFIARDMFVKDETVGDKIDAFYQCEANLDTICKIILESDEVD